MRPARNRGKPLGGSLTAMAAPTVLMVAEKVAPSGHDIGRAAAHLTVGSSNGLYPNA